MTDGISVEVEDLADPDDWRHGRANVGGPTLHYVESGPGSGADTDLVILLHGFPGFWYDWRDQLDPLAEAGYRAVAPDLRGYNRSSKPQGVSEYRMERLVADVAGLIDALGAEQVHLVGHDWGGVVAWETAIRRPAIVRRLGILNAPHPSAYRRAVRSGDQLWRSWYALFFQLPWLPERSLQAEDYEGVERILKAGTTTDAFDDGDLRRYRNAIARPGALTATLNYYRAAGRAAARHEGRRLFGRTTGTSAVEVPTLVCWGEQDPALSSDVLAPLGEYVEDLRVVRYEDAGHWVQLDAAKRVNEALLDFLAEPGSVALGGEQAAQ